MDSFREQSTKFEIESVIEQKSFENPAVQSFFEKWCELNDSIQPQIVSRTDWEQRGMKDILEKNHDGTQVLYIPEDLQLWEMIGVMEAVDRDTFAENPERQGAAKEKLLELGEIFKNSGVYIAQRLDSIEQGGIIARALAEEFYGYGKSLISGKRSNEPQTIEDIAQQNLTNEERDTVDRFLAGDSFYKSRQARAEKAATTSPTQKDEFYEAERQKTLAQFFRTSEKAFELQNKTESEESGKITSNLKPWQSDVPFHSAFIKKVEKAMAQKIEMPKSELTGSIFRRGMELMKKNMPFDKLPYSIQDTYLHWQDEEKTLREALRIDRLREELRVLKQEYSISNKQIATKESEIADKIQGAVSSFPYKVRANNPSEIIATQQINCVGASMLGGALFQEAGLHYLVGDLPKHSILFLVTSDGRVEWRDMLNSRLNEDLTDDMIAGSKKNGEQLTTADIVAFSKAPSPRGLMFDIKSEYGDKFWWIAEGQRQYVTVFEPGYGQKIQVFNNTGNVLSDLGLKKEAIEAYREAIALDPQFAYAHHGLGKVLYNLGLKKEAIEAYREAIALDPQFADTHLDLGNALRSLNRKQEAIKEYQRFIDLADKQQDDYLIKQAEQRIAGLKKRGLKKK